MSMLGEAAIDGPGGLLECLAAVPDPRLKRGVRHAFHTILAIAVCAFLSNCHNYLSMGYWARELPPSLLKRFGCRFDGRRYVPPSESTLRRTLQTADVAQVDRVVGEWLFSQTTGRGIAVDGKTVRGSAQSDRRALHLLSAFVHQEGMTVAQRAVDPSTNEITQLAPLLAPLDLRGKVVTADAMHTHQETARYLVETKDADYLLAVKDNQPTLLENLQALEPGDFSPSPPGDQPGPRPGGTTHGPGEHHPQ